MAENNEQITFEFEPKKTIKGYPELHWTGKRPFKSTVYYPAQLKNHMGKVFSLLIRKVIRQTGLIKFSGAIICKL